MNGASPSMSSNLAHCFIRVPGTNHIRITAVGRKLFAQRFARHGINIDTLKTTQHFLQAQNAVMCAELNAARLDKNCEPVLKKILDELLD